VETLTSLGNRAAFAPPRRSQIDPLDRSSELDPVSPPAASAFAVLHSLSVRRSSAVDAAGREWGSHVSPSAGGTHSIRPLLYVRTSTGGCWFRAGRDYIVQVKVPQASALLTAMRAASDGPLFSAIVAVAEPDVLFARYPDGISLLWRDAGAFCAAAQFVADSYALRSRIIGIATELEGADRLAPACAVGAVALSGREGM
jgi:hypothetical protein